MMNIKNNNFKMFTSSKLKKLNERAEKIKRESKQKNKVNNKLDKLYYLAILSEKCNNYQEMIINLEAYAKAKINDLTEEEKKLLSYSYKKKIDSLRNAIDKIKEYESAEKLKQESAYLSSIEEYKWQIIREIIFFCNSVCQTLESTLLPKANDESSKLYYMKMKGDYYRYISESVEKEIKLKYSKLAFESYNQAQIISEKINDYLNPTKLDHILNFSIFLHDIMNKKKEAYDIVSEAVDKVQKALEEYNKIKNDKKKKEEEEERLRLEQSYEGLKKLNFMDLIIKIAAEKDEENDNEDKGKIKECEMILQKLNENLEFWEDEDT